MAAADLVLTITTETKRHMITRRVVTLGLAAGCATAAALILPTALSGGGGSTQSAAAAAYSSDAPDVELDCLQWAALGAADRQSAATFWEVTSELATNVRAPGDFSPPPARAVAAEAREIDDSCRAALADARAKHLTMTPLVVRALRDFRRP